MSSQPSEPERLTRFKNLLLTGAPGCGGVGTGVDDRVTPPAASPGVAFAGRGGGVAPVDIHAPDGGDLTETAPRGPS